MTPGVLCVAYTGGLHLMVDVFSADNEYGSCRPRQLVFLRLLLIKGKRNQSHQFFLQVEQNRRFYSGFFRDVG